MEYRLKAKTLKFYAVDDLDAILRSSDFLKHLKFVIYGPDNEVIGEAALSPLHDEELDFEFNCPEMAQIRQFNLCSLSADARSYVNDIMRRNSYIRKDLRERSDKCDNFGNHE